MGGSTSIYGVKGYQTYRLHSTNDPSNVSITGLCSLPNGNFLAVDNNNKRVKQLSRQYDVISHLDFQSTPIDICRLGDYKVAVTVEKEIHFLDASNSQLKLINTVACDHHCEGIDYHNDALFVTSGTALYIYNSSGKLVKKIYEDGTGTNTVYRVSVARDGHHIYVTNHSNHQLITLDNEGNRLATFSDPSLRFPAGLCTLNIGTVFVCGQNSDNVLHVNSQGTDKLATIKKSDEVHSPRALLFDEETAKFFVGQNDNDNNLLVMSFELKHDRR